MYGVNQTILKSCLIKTIVTEKCKWINKKKVCFIIMLKYAEEINLNYFMPVCYVNRYNETTCKLQILKISYI